MNGLAALRQACRGNVETRETREAVAALAELGPQARPAAADLGEVLRQYPWRPLVARQVIAVVGALGRMGRDARPALPQLCRLLEVEEGSIWDDELHQAAAEALGRLGLLARAAVPKLRKLRGDVNEKVAQAAREALTRIEAGGDPQDRGQR